MNEIRLITGLAFAISVGLLREIKRFYCEIPSDGCIL
jgi:hypothetical protein